MAHENEETLKRICELFTQGPKASAQVFDLFDPELEIHDYPGVPDGESHHGHEGLGNWAAKVWNVMDDIEVVPSEIIEAPDGRLVFRLDGAGTGASSRIRVSAVFYGVATFRDGKMLRGLWYRTKPEALEAAGLSE